MLKMKMFLALVAFFLLNISPAKCATIPVDIYGAYSYANKELSTF